MFNFIAVHLLNLLLAQSSPLESPIVNASILISTHISIQPLINTSSPNTWRGPHPLLAQYPAVAALEHKSELVPPYSTASVPSPVVASPTTSQYLQSVGFTDEVRPAHTPDISVATPSKQNGEFLESKVLLSSDFGRLSVKAGSSLAKSVSPPSDRQGASSRNPQY